MFRLILQAVFVLASKELDIIPYIQISVTIDSQFYPSKYLGIQIPITLAGTLHYLAYSGDNERKR